VRRLLAPSLKRLTPVPLVSEILKYHEIENHSQLTGDVRRSLKCCCHLGIQVDAVVSLQLLVAFFALLSHPILESIPGLGEYHVDDVL
jgi:hypothetical protein